MIRHLWPLLFFIVPLAEIYLLIQIGSQIGAAVTILLVVVTAAVGVTLLRHQGLKTLMKANRVMSAGQIPALEMFEGFMLAAAGIMLLTPGFVTDAAGFMLLIPSIRKLLIHQLLRKMTVSQYYHHTTHHQQSGPRTIEGEYWKEDK